ncbi:MAG: DUF4352 domain-containing protein [Bacteroidales bacterium]|jgi:hypothetical protein|nr:DUF4352 domain-containing protein [Bacteroidales bacterium]
MVKTKIQSGFAFLAVVLVLIALAIACSGSSTSEPDLVGKVGETINTGKFAITVSSVTSRNRVGNEYFNEKAPAGATFIAVNFNYKNISKEPISSFSVPDVKLIDPNNVTYEPAVGASGYYAAQINLNKKVASDLNPGISQRDAAVFEVSKEIWAQKGWKIRISADKNIDITIN